MKTKLLILVAFCMLAMATTLNAAVSAVRTAKTVDVIWTPDANAVTYKVMGLNNVVLATMPASTLIAPNTTFSKTIFGLQPNTEYTFSVASVDASNAETILGSVTVTTRRNGTDFEIIEDFDNMNQSVWGVSNKGTFTPQEMNLKTTGINTSDLCGKWASNCANASNRNYAGPANAYERITVGPNVKFQYLHVKMYRVVTGTPLVGSAEELGGFSIQMNGRADSSVYTAVNNKKYYNTAFVDGAWHDYVWDLKALGNGTDKSFFNWYFKMNEFGGGTYALQTEYNAFIDDVYLSNSSTPITNKIEPVALTLIAGANGTVPVSGTYLKGSTIVATPAAGYVIDNWSDGTNVISTTNTCVVPGVATLTATFKVATGINDLVDAGVLRIKSNQIDVLQSISSLQIYNTLGGLVNTYANLTEGSTISLERGVYLLRVKTEKGLKVQKVVLQ